MADKSNIRWLALWVLETYEPMKKQCIVKICNDSFSDEGGADGSAQQSI